MKKTYTCTNFHKIRSYRIYIFSHQLCILGFCLNSLSTRWEICALTDLKNSLSYLQQLGVGQFPRSPETTLTVVTRTPKTLLNSLLLLFQLIRLFLWRFLTKIFCIFIAGCIYYQPHRETWLFEYLKISLFKFLQHPTPFFTPSLLDPNGSYSPVPSLLTSSSQIKK